MRAGEKRLQERATAGVEERLTAYQPMETDPLLVEELQKIIRSGMKGDDPLPEVPKAVGGAAGSANEANGRRRRRRVAR
jgi:hypothetical protein